MLFTACNNSDSSKKNKKPTTEKTVNGKKGKKTTQVTNVKNSKYWLDVKKKLAISDKQLTELKSIQKKFNNRISDLKAQKKWDGDANEKRRTKLQVNKNTELKKLLGSKYDKWKQLTK